MEALKVCSTTLKLGLALLASTSLLPSENTLAQSCGLKSPSLDFVAPIDFLNIDKG